MRKTNLFAFVAISSLASLIFFHYSGRGEEVVEQTSHTVQIPFRLVFIQAANFAVLIGILVYFFKDKVKMHFAERRKSYLELVSRADAAKLEASRRVDDLRSKIENLSLMHAENIRSARQESEKIRRDILNTADATAQRVKNEARQAVGVEVAKAKDLLRLELLKIAIDTSGNRLKTLVGESEKVRLQNDFAQKLEVVRE